MTRLRVGLMYGRSIYLWNTCEELTSRWHLPGYVWGSTQDAHVIIKRKSFDSSHEADLKRGICLAFFTLLKGLVYTSVRGMSWSEVPGVNWGYSGVGSDVLTHSKLVKHIVATRLEIWYWPVPVRKIEVLSQDDGVCVDNPIKGLFEKAGAGVICDIWATVRANM